MKEFNPSATKHTRLQLASCVTAARCLAIMGVLTVFGCRDTVEPRMKVREVVSRDVDAGSACWGCPLPVIQMRYDEGPRTEREFDLSADSVKSYELIVEMTGKGGVAVVKVNHDKVATVYDPLRASTRFAVPLRLKAANRVHFSLIGSAGTTAKFSIVRQIAERVLDEQGGTLSLASGAKLIIPAGALSGQMTFRLADTASVESSRELLTNGAYVFAWSGGVSFAAGAQSIQLRIPGRAPAVGSIGDLRGAFSIAPNMPMHAGSFFDPSSREFVQMLNGGAFLQLPSGSISFQGEQFTAEQLPELPAPMSGSSVLSSITHTRHSAPLTPCYQYPLRRDDRFSASESGKTIIVLVHGWDRGLTSCNEYMNRQLNGDEKIPGEHYFHTLLEGMQEDFLNHPLRIFSYPSYADYRYTGAWLANRLAAIRGSTGASGVVLVGHSMGGLVARSAVEFLSGYGIPVDFVRGIITLGTPHIGTEAGLARLAGWVSAGSTTPGGLSLLPGAALPQVETAPIYAFGGDISLRCGLWEDCVPFGIHLEFLARDAFCFSFPSTGCQSDGVVPITSSLPSFIPAARHFGNEYTHGEQHAGFLGQGGVTGPAGPGSDPHYETLFSVLTSLLTSSIGNSIADLTATTVNAPSQMNGGSTYTMTWGAVNLGNRSADEVHAAYYLSTDATITTSDIQIGGLGSDLVSLTAGETQSLTDNITIPVGQAPGMYYVGVIIDHLNEHQESNESNNTVVTAATVQIGPRPPGTTFFDDFNNGLTNWTPRGGGSWITQNGELFGNYGTFLHSLLVSLQFAASTHTIEVLDD